MKTKRNFITYAFITTGIAVILLYLFAGGLLLFRIIFESNHISYSLYNYLTHCILSLALGLLFIFFKIIRLGKVIVVISISEIVVIFLLDHLNILVEYHEWIQRGMPDKFQIVH
jgi:hypothetical protein